MTNAAVPFIPDTAPFSSEQRQWLNDMLAGMFSATAPVQVKAGLDVNVVFASQSGTAERLAKKMAKLLKADGHNAVVRSAETLTAEALAQMEHAVFFASTYGEGEPPDSARGFSTALFSDAVPRMDRLRYSVFCLGDRNYEQFCRFGLELDARLELLGATRVHAAVEADVDVDAPFQAWQSKVSAGLREPPVAPASVAKKAVAAVAAQLHTRENPCHAELVEKRTLTHPSSSKQTIHFSFDLADADISYEAGDACGVLPQNDPALVAEIMHALPFTASDKLNLPKVGAVSVEDALMHHLQPTRLTRKAVQAFARKAQCGTLSALLATENATHLESYLHGRGLLDLLHAYPGVLSSPADLAEIVPRLTPRLYSISSSPAAHGRQVHCTIAVVRYNAHDRERGGVASTMLADRMAAGSRVPIYIQPNKRFRLPTDPDASVIMIGPGTGIAPFRGFLHERQAKGHSGCNWLFFGERSAETDFLYCDELRKFTEDGHLTRLSTAFSRDQEHKVYVQDRMLESGAELFRWLQDGASVYVCGDASRMAKDVDAALHHIVETHGQLSHEAAQEYVAQLNEDHRYHRDVY